VTGSSEDEVATNARQRAESVYRRMLLAFGVGFAVVAVVAVVLTHEVGIVILLALAYGLVVVIARWGMRSAIPGVSDRRDIR
jgi:uncharacterized membrane protein